MADPDLDAPLSRTAASAAVADVGWRYLLGDLAVSVPVRSLAQGKDVAAAAMISYRSFGQVWRDPVKESAHEPR